MAERRTDDHTIECAELGTECGAVSGADCGADELGSVLVSEPVDGADCGAERCADGCAYGSTVVGAIVVAERSADDVAVGCAYGVTDRRFGIRLAEPVDGAECGTEWCAYGGAVGVAICDAF